MRNVIKIILSILYALLGFLIGWFVHAWKNRGKVAKEVKQAIVDLNKEHKKALEAMRKKYNEKLNEKGQIIKSLTQIIERLLKLFDEKNEYGASLSSSNKSVNKLVDFLYKKLEELKKMQNSPIEDSDK